jgi:hypothetical protein
VSLHALAPLASSYPLVRPSASRLDPELKWVDLRLHVWSGWARPHYGQLGYPARSVTERANEGGILANDFRPPVSPEWPEDVVETETQVARLPTRHLAAVMANYFYPNWIAEARARLYCDFARYLARTRLQHISRRPTRIGPRAFPDDLDRALWSIKHALEL